MTPFEFAGVVAIVAARRLATGEAIHPDGPLGQALLIAGERCKTHKEAS